MGSPFLSRFCALFDVILLFFFLSFFSRKKQRTPGDGNGRHRVAPVPGPLVRETAVVQYGRLEARLLQPAQGARDDRCRQHALPGAGMLFLG